MDLNTFFNPSFTITCHRIPPSLFPAADLFLTLVLQNHLVNAGEILLSYLTEHSLDTVQPLHLWGKQNAGYNPEKHPVFFCTISKWKVLTRKMRPRLLEAPHCVNLCETKIIVQSNHH